MIFLILIAGEVGNGKFFYETAYLKNNSKKKIGFSANEICMRLRFQHWAYAGSGLGLFPQGISQM